MSALVPIRIEWVGVEPMPAPRRFVVKSGSQTYMPKDYVAYREALGWMMIQARAKANQQPRFQGLVGLYCQFARSTKHRVDLDNLLKSVMDAGNGGVLFDDDSQVRRIQAELVLGADMPGMTVEAYDLDTTGWAGPDVSATASRRAPAGSSRHLHATGPDATPESAATLTEPDSEGDESDA